MWKKIKNFFIKLVPTKRRIIQVYAALLYNANIKGFISGEIFKGVSKSACLPGLNCYSCPGAIGACPLGSLQNALYASKTKLPTYVLGIILLYSIILGRTICGFLCPVGLFQELLYKIRTPKLRKSRVTRVLSYFKYVLLIVLVIILPFVYAHQNMPLPAFCKYICPAGTFEGAILLLINPNNDNFFGMLGPLFTWKFILLILFIVASIFIFRFFCRFICPLGAIYGLFNKISILGVKIDKSACTNCGACITSCKMDVKEVGDHECIQCGECRKVCKANAINWKVISKIVKEETREQVKEENDKIVKLDNKSRKISQRAWNKIIGIVMAAFLLAVILVTNFTKNVYQVNDVCDDLKMTTTTNEMFDITKNNQAVLLYFSNQIDNEDILMLKSLYHQELLVMIVTNQELNEASLNLNENNIAVVKTQNNDILKKFITKDVDQYRVLIDLQDKIIFSKQEIDQEDQEIIKDVLAGKIVGNQVGNICINKNINLIGQEGTFSVLKNRGKITVINFWYKDCTPCVAELPYFNKVYNEYQEYISVIAIHEAEMYADDPDEKISFINTKFKDFNIMFGYDNTDSPYYEELGGEGAWPTTIIVNEEGIIEYVNHGSLTESDLRYQIESIINK